MASSTALNSADPEGLGLPAITQVLVEVDGGPGKLLGKLLLYLDKLLLSMLEMARGATAVGIESTAAALLCLGRRVRTATALLDGVLQEAFRSNMAGVRQRMQHLLVLALRAAELPDSIWKLTVLPLTLLLLSPASVGDVAAHLWALLSPSFMDRNRAMPTPGQNFIAGILATELHRKLDQALLPADLDRQMLKGQMNCVILAANIHRAASAPAVEPGSDSEQSEDVASASEGEEAISDGDNFSDLDDFLDFDPSQNVFGFLAKEDRDPAVAGHCGSPGSIREFFAATRAIPDWRHRVDQLLKDDHGEVLKRPAAAEPMLASKRRCATASRR